jgi:hypothetical protein
MDGDTRSISGLRNGVDMGGGDTTEPGIEGSCTRVIGVDVGTARPVKAAAATSAGVIDGDAWYPPVGVAVPGAPRPMPS